jgi:hypothetical protein
MASVTVQLTTRTADQARQPILARLCKDFPVVPNIKRAQICEDQAFVELEIEGELEEVQRAIAWLHTTGLSVDAKQRSVGKDTRNL